MINLIESSPRIDEILAILGKHRRRDLLPPLDAPAWENVGRKSAVQKWMVPVRAMAETEAHQPLPPLTDELYAQFFKTGERLSFEKVYFARRRILGRTAMVVLLGDAAGRAKFTPALIAQIGQIMDEESWTFPAHVWTEPSGKNPMHIDLFAAETANLMGELVNVFGNILPKDLTERIRHRLRTQFVENYLKRHEEFTWTGLPMNWNAVCHQGVIGAALAVEEDNELVARLLATAGPHLRIFLAGFGADGSTSEGPGYWSYGFGRFAALNEQVEAATSGQLSVFGTSEHIRRIAAFAPALSLSNGYLVNFSDGGRKGRLVPYLLSYLGRRLDLPNLVQDSVEIYRNFEQAEFDLNEQRKDFYNFARLFLDCPVSTAQTTPTKRPDAYFPDYGAVVSRSVDERGNLWEFAAKGGNNDEHHNHNDCGSYLLNLNGEPAIIEIGAPEYVRAYFGTDERYTFLAARSLGHSVPLVNGCEQAAGAAFAASVVSCKLEPAQVEFVVDLTKCYPAEARCTKLLRTFRFLKSEGVVHISDEYHLEGEGSIESIVMAEAPIVPESDVVRIDAPGGALQLVPGVGIQFSTVEVCDYHDNSGTSHQVSRLRFHPATPAKSGVIGYKIRSTARGKQRADGGRRT
jgi:hypothetical protein